MYVHFNFNATNLEAFPVELGVVNKEFNIDDNNVLTKIHYYSNENPIIDLESLRGGLEGVKNINLLIGSNNSGKSRFLRALFKEANRITISKNQISLIDEYNELLKDIIVGKKVSYTDRTGQDIQSFWEENIYAYDRVNEQIDIKNQLGKIRAVYKDRQSHIEDISDSEYNGIVVCINAIDKILSFIDNVRTNSNFKPKDKLYIPVYRTLVEDEGFQRQVFEKIIENKYGINKNIFTGQRLYTEVLKKHTSSRIIELDAFSEWIKKNFNENKNVRIIPDDESSNILLNIDGDLTPVYDLGDGVQQLILLMFPIYTAEDGTWFFIEEPETHLHPGLQRIFIETLLNDEHLKKKNLRFFFTTHSNHFLDISLDHEEISIFQFEKESSEKFNIKTNVKPSKEILDLLGVNTSSVFLANTSIWVEGPTDRKYISKWLKLYCEHKGLPYLKEDIDFAFFEYGGNLIEHYLFDKSFDEDVTEAQVRKKIKAFALSNKVYLLADNDNVEEGSAKYKRRENLQGISDKNFKYQNTEYREIENLLPVKIIKDFIPELVKQHEGYESIGLNRSDYYNKGLGDYFESILKPNFDCKKFKAPSGTLNNLYKNKLCDFFVNGNYNYSDLIKENQQLEEVIENLYSFIVSK
ncbi:hypothetical protein DVK85_04940 [Flavobacterium arcticum]|uniref:Endonuclease GajA/Old nuclease/RecF-like AAA domain-containing protein n=1 Tax=Flavobacterium arcticum TaxID=1784713 RepID=A0A345HAK0_9FLAO|nr:ATP-binding protein [Flavobacterium arcticum]AXG73610.1 hypothetical protein DVK85_04940 [Flavobacterium arcticum]KAF2506411.1 ATP-binding protein [Flavobacterium arcticum]